MEVSKLKNILMTGTVSLGLMTLVTVATPAHAGGILGDAINVVAPGVGTRLDEIHTQIGKPLDQVAAVAVAPVTIPLGIGGALVSQPITNVGHSLAQDFNGAVNNLKAGIDGTLDRTKASFMEMMIEGSIVILGLFVAIKLISAFFSLFTRRRRVSA